MQYVFLAYHDEKSWEALSAHERQAFARACLASEQDLLQSGHLLAGVAPQSDQTAITVRVVDGQLSLTEGVISEGEGRLTRIFFIHARDLNEAIQVAANLPQARRGPIEVRPAEVDP